MLKAMSKPQGVLKMFMLGVLKTILKTVLKLSFGFARVTEVRHIWKNVVKYAHPNYVETFMYCIRITQIFMDFCQFIPLSFT